MNRRRLTGVGLLIALLLLASGAVWILKPCRYGWTTEELETLIKKAIPQDSDRATVEAWFSVNSIMHERFEGGNLNLLQLRRNSSIANSEKASYYLRGTIGQKCAKVSYFYEGYIYIYTFILILTIN